MGTAIPAPNIGGQKRPQQRILWGQLRPRLRQVGELDDKNLTACARDFCVAFLAAEPPGARLGRCRGGTSKTERSSYVPPQGGEGAPFLRGTVAPERKRDSKLKHIP
jgi:hypothetical protein